MKIFNINRIKTLIKNIEKKRKILYNIIEELYILEEEK